MTKRKEIQEVVNNEIIKIEEPKKLYKYEIGDEVFVMQNNKVHSFIVEKRIILTRKTNNDNVETKVYYDDNNYDSMKAIYVEDVLYPSKSALLNSL